MIKRMIILIVMGLTLSSCQLFTEAIKDNMYRVELARERKEARKKDGPGAIMTELSSIRFSSNKKREFLSFYSQKFS